MTSLELFSVFLTLGGAAAAVMYTYALNRSPSRPKSSEDDGSSETLTKEAQARHQASEKQLEEAVTRADLAAASAESAAARAEAASQVRGVSRVMQKANGAYILATADLAETLSAGLNLKQYTVVHPFGGTSTVLGPDDKFVTETTSRYLIEAGIEGSSSEQKAASTPERTFVQ